MLDDFVLLVVMAKDEQAFPESLFGQFDSFVKNFVSEFSIRRKRDRFESDTHVWIVCEGNGNILLNSISGSMDATNYRNLSRNSMGRSQDSRGMTSIVLNRRHFFGFLLRFGLYEHGQNPFVR